MLNKAKEKYKNKSMLEDKKQKLKDYQSEYRKNVSDEQKQKYREAKRHKYHNMTDEERQKIKDYQSEYRKNMSDEQKQRMRGYHKKYYMDKRCIRA